MNIGTRVKAMREQRGLKAVFVAEKIGLSGNMLSMIEREKCNVTVKQAIAFADFFGVSLDYLVRGDDYLPKSHNEQRLSA